MVPPTVFSSDVCCQPLFLKMSKACQWSPGMNSELSSLQLGFTGHMFKILGPFRLLSNYVLNLSASSHVMLKVHKTTGRQEGASCVFSGRVQAREKEGGVCRTSLQEEQTRVCTLVTYHVNPQKPLFSTLVAVIPLDHSLRSLWWSGGIWAGPTGPSCAVGLLLCSAEFGSFS